MAKNANLAGFRVEVSAYYTLRENIECGHKRAILDERREENKGREEVRPANSKEPTLPLVQERTKNAP